MYSYPHTCKKYCHRGCGFILHVAMGVKNLTYLTYRTFLKAKCCEITSCSYVRFIKAILQPFIPYIDQNHPNPHNFTRKRFEMSESKRDTGTKRDTCEENLVELILVHSTRLGSGTTTRCDCGGFRCVKSRPRNICIVWHQTPPIID